jgi:uncharacterized protein YcbX
MRVLGIWRYPVKAMLGEQLHDVVVGPTGCAGDRRWIVVDAATGDRIANKRGATDRRLRACRAAIADEAGGPHLRVTTPGGDVVEGVSVEAALSDLLDRRVRLVTSTTAGEGRFAATGAYHDLAPIHMITTSTLSRLRAAEPTFDWDVRRFRPNVLLDDGPAGETFAEDLLLGSVLRGPSGVGLDVGLPTPRCVVPTRAQDGLPADPGLLRAIVAQHRIDLGQFGRQGCVGAYAEVVQAGPIRVGERLALEPGQTTPADALAAVIARLRRET